MAIISEQAYIADGTQREFQVVGTILSDSHIGVWIVDYSTIPVTETRLPTAHYDVLGSTVLLDVPPQAGLTVSLVLTDNGEGIEIPPSEITDISANINKIINVSDNIEHIITNSDNMQSIIDTASIKDEVVDVADIKTQVVSILNDKIKLDSIYNDKAKLDSIFADKATLDSIFANKLTLDTLYSMKEKLDSLYADKNTLDSLYADKTELDSIYANLNAILSIHQNIDNVNYFADRYIGDRYIEPTTRLDGSSLLEGDLYFDKTIQLMRVYSNEGWKVAYASTDSYTKAEIANLFVGVSGAQTIDGVKTFNSSIVGNITGNSGTATKLATARTINGVSFDGSADITAPTNLGITGGTTAGPVVTSSTGTNATLPTASATASGVVTTGNQTIVGTKTFTSNPLVATPTIDQQVANKKYVDDKVTDAKNYTDTRVNEVVGQLSTDYYQGAYGISWDYATDTYIRTGAKGYTAIQSLMRRCVLNADGTVNYYLNPDNSNFKEDGTPSVLTGADGNVMVEIPKHYIKVETVGNVDSFSVSLTPEVGYVLDPAFLKWNGTKMVEVPYRYFRAYTGFVSGGKLLSVSGVTPTNAQTIAAFRTQAMANGAGWHLTDWNLLNTIKRLCCIEFCNFIVTKYLGNGNNVGNDLGITTGQSNALGNRSSNSTHNNMYMTYRGIENLYADICEFVDGVNINNYQFYVNGKYSTFQSDIFTGDYVAKGPLAVAGASNSLIKRCAVSVDGGFIPKVLGGSTTTFYGDALWSATGARIAFYGGSSHASYYGGDVAGLSNMSMENVSSISAGYVGASVCR